MTGSGLDLPVHLLGRERTPHQPPRIDMRQHPLQYNDRSIDHDTEIDGPQTHQVGGDPENTHQDKSEKHRQRDHGSHDQTGPHIPQEDDQYDKDDQRSLYQVTDHGGYISVYQFGTIQIRFYTNTFRQHFLYPFDPCLQFLGHDIGVRTLQHHGDTAHALSLAILCHGSKTLGGTKANRADIAYMNRYPSTVRDHDALDVLYLADHSLATDVVSLIDFLDITAARILVIPVERLEHLADRNIQGIKGIRIYRHLILFQIAAKAIDLHDTRYTAQLPFHDPVLNGTEFHGVVFLLITGLHAQYILINLAQAGRDRHQLRRTQFRGDFSRHGLYLLVYKLAGIQGRHAFLKHDRYQ